MGKQLKTEQTLALRTHPELRHHSRVLVRDPAISDPERDTRECFRFVAS
jgi:hypothetical protein